MFPELKKKRKRASKLENPELFSHVCTECGKSYASKASLKAHESKNHQSNLTESTGEKIRKVEMNFEEGDSVYHGFKLDGSSINVIYYRGDVIEVHIRDGKLYYDVKFDDKKIGKKMSGRTLTRILPPNSKEYEKNKKLR